MYKLLDIILASCFRYLWSVAVWGTAMVGHAQQTPIRPIPTDSSYYLPLPKAFKDSYYYFQGAVTFPLGQSGQLPNTSASLLDPFRGNTGTGATMGYAIETGYRRAFVVNHTQASRIYPFWGVALGGGYNALDWTALGGAWSQQARTQLAQGAGLVHLGIALKQHAKWVLECHGGLLLPIVTVYPDTRIEGSAGQPTDFSLRVKEGTGSWSPGFTAGLTWRTRHFRIGAEMLQHRSTVSYDYWELKPEYIETYDAFFNWRTIRCYLGVQF